MATRLKRPRSDKPHPLESVAMKAFAERPAQDRVTMAEHMAGGYVSPGFKSYMLVAKDVLGYMECQGKVYQDNCGWHRLTTTKGSNAERTHP